MLHLDALELHELPEASRLLLADAVRLEREAGLAKIPSTRVGGALAFPSPWVRAAAGIDPVDEESSRRYWLARLAPPPRTSHRARRPRAVLPTSDLLSPEEASRRLLADDARLARWDGDGTLPALRVDGETRYDETLVDLLARGDEGVGARRALVQDWSRFEYETEAPPHAASPAALPPRAFEIPADLVSEVAEEPAPPPPPSRRLLRTEGFETVDED